MNEFFKQLITDVLSVYLESLPLVFSGIRPRGANLRNNNKTNPIINNLNCGAVLKK